MPDYIYNDKTGLYYLASKVFSDNYVGIPLTPSEMIKMNQLEKEYELEILQARYVIMSREEFKDLDYFKLLNFCAELLIQFRIENAKESKKR